MRALIVSAGFMVVLSALSVTAIAQNAPQPYPTVLISLPPAAPTPTPDPSTRQRMLARARLMSCINERKIADTVLIETAKSDGVVGGVMKRLGNTRFTLDDLGGDQMPAYYRNGNTGGGPQFPVPSPLPFETPFPTFIIARDAARDSSLPYWTGTRKLLDASGDLETSVKAAAAAVDKLQAQVNIDPDPQRRKQLQEVIAALTDAIVKQAPLVKDLEKFIITADAQLSAQEAHDLASQGGSNSIAPMTTALLNRDPDSDGYKLLHQATDAHEATVKAIKLANDVSGPAFADCAVPHPQTTPAAKR